MRQHIMRFALLSMIAAMACAQEPHPAVASDLTSLRPGLNVEIQIDHDGRSRRILVTTPLQYDSDRAYPVLFAFHGAGGKAEGQSRRWNPHVNSRDFILISVEAVRPLAKWNFMDGFHRVDHDDVGLVRLITHTLISAGIADPRRIYATGHSSGGLFCYRLAKETSLFAAVSPMSCGMAKGAHDPAKETQPVSIMQVIGDQDKSYHGSTNPRITMYSAAQRVEIWRSFNQCDPEPETSPYGDKMSVRTYSNRDGIEVAICEVKDEGHHIRRDLRRITDSLALDFMFRHKRN